MNPFEMTLLALLQERAKEDALFAETLKKPNKSIAECAKYIYGELAEEARKSNGGNTACIAIADGVDTKIDGAPDVLSMAVHYFDEDDIKIKPINGEVKTATPKTGKATPSKTATPKAETKKAEEKKPVKKNLLLESLKKETKKEDKPKLSEVAKKDKKETKAEKKETKKNTDFVGSLFDF